LPSAFRCHSSMLICCDPDGRKEEFAEAEPDVVPALYALTPSRGFRIQKRVPSSLELVAVPAPTQEVENPSTNACSENDPADV
jgi:hypothetical protein